MWSSILKSYYHIYWKKSNPNKQLEIKVNWEVTAVSVDFSSPNNHHSNYLGSKFFQLTPSHLTTHLGKIKFYESFIFFLVKSLWDTWKASESLYKHDYPREPGIYSIHIMKYAPLLSNYVYIKMFTGNWEIWPNTYPKHWVFVWSMMNLPRKKMIVKDYTEYSFIIIHCRSRMEEKHKRGEMKGELQRKPDF